LLFSRKTRPPLEVALAEADLPLTGLPTAPLFAATSLLTYPMVCGLLILAVLALDVLGTDSGEPARLAEFTALCFYTQVPYCLLMIAIAWVWVPESFTLPSGVSAAELLFEVRRYRSTLLSEPLLSTGRLLSFYSLLWLAAVVSIALKVVGGLSPRATVVVAVVLFAICNAGTIIGAGMRLLT